MVAHRHSAAGDLRSEMRTSSLAGTTGDNSGLDATTGGDTRTTVSGADDGGVTTLGVVLIAAGALAAGASVGVAGGRGLRTAR